MDNLTDFIKVENIPCYTKIGVADNEREIGQTLIIDLQAYMDLRQAGNVDELESTISYVEFSKSVQNTTQKRDYKLIENLASCVAEDLLQNFPKVQAVRVRVSKPHIPNVEFKGSASATIFRSR
jgi:dihydroneopterin aldolase